LSQDGRDSEQIKYLALQRGELAVEDLHGVRGAGQPMAFGVSEEAQELLGGRPFAAAFFRVQR
jgi:hypothetical protein